MFITVLICSRNRADSLRQTLESLLHPVNLGAKDWEVLVVESSTDHTRQLCREFQERFPEHFRFITERKLGKSTALNTGIAAANGDILAFTDDDVLCAPHYIQAIRTVFASYPVDAAQGRVLLDCEGGWPDWLDRTCAQMADFRDLGDEAIDLVGTLFGVNMVVRAKVFETVGGFVPELGPGGMGSAEDTEISWRIRKAGYRLLYAPQIELRHRWSRDRLTKRFIRQRYFEYGRFMAYYEMLPVSAYRFGLYVLKLLISKGMEAIWHRCVGRPAVALNCQCEARKQAGLFWQHWLFKWGAPRTFSRNPLFVQSRIPSANMAPARESSMEQGRKTT